MQYKCVPASFAGFFFKPYPTPALPHGNMFQQLRLLLGTHYCTTIYSAYDILSVQQDNKDYTFSSSEHLLLLNKKISLMSADAEQHEFCAVTSVWQARCKNPD